MNKILPTALFLCAIMTAHTAPAAEPAISTYTEQSSALSVKATWQRFGLALPDKESDDLVRNFVDEFRTSAEQEQEERKSDPSLPSLPFEMVLEGNISGNGRVSGILWNAYEYTGGAHGSILVFAKNYANGKVVGLNDLFRKPEKALALMSELSRKKLLEQDLPKDMVEAGTTPEKDNFNTFLLEKDGLTLYFNPYQVGPWAAGVITVKLTLKELAAAGPDMSFWN